MSKLTLFLVGIPGLSIFVWLTTAVNQIAEAPVAILIPAAIVFLLVLLNAFFVAAEFAIIGVRSTQLEPLADEGNTLATKILGILDSRNAQDQYIATAQLGITIASLGLAMYGEPQISHLVEPHLAVLLGVEPHAAIVHSIGYIIALSLLTYLHIVVGEMVPKSLALSDALKTVLWVARPMQWAGFILHIPVRILNAIGNWLLHLFRIPPAQGHARVLSAEELELIVSESAEGGVLNEEEEEMILNIFNFSERLVGQVMTPRTKVQAIPYNIPIETLLALVSASKHSRFPVYTDNLDHINGILHVKDLLRHMVRSRGSVDIRLLLRQVPAVPEDYSVAMLLAAFKRQHLHMAVVVDEFGGMAGIVTLEDLVEEVVGEVRDEFDQEKEPYVEIEPGVLEVVGNYLVDDLKGDVYLGTEDELPDVETVGGLIITRLGRPPKVGDEVIYHQHVHLKVLDVDRRAVTRVRIEFPVHLPEEDGEKPRNGK